MTASTSGTPRSLGRRLAESFRSGGQRLAARLRQWRVGRAFFRLDVAAALQACPSQPLYSVVVPIFRTDRHRLRRCLQSIRDQFYPQWELLLVDDGSQQPELTTELHRWTRRDERIRAFALPTHHGVSAAMNRGLAEARGEFVGFLDPHDELTPDALLWLAVAHNRHPRSRWFYSDEARLERNGTSSVRFHRKPDFSWEFLLANMYTRHLSVYQRSVLETVGGLRPDFDGAQDHDLALRVSERVIPDEVTHIPHVLYLSRATRRSPTRDPAAESQAAGAGRRAVQEAVLRRKLLAHVRPDADCPPLFHLDLRPRTRPSVAVVIPTRNGVHLVQRCVQSLRANAAYPNYEIVIIDNQSDDPELARYLRALSAGAPVRTVRYDQPFNHSDMHNRIVPQLEAELIALVNNDVYGFSPRWLEQLVATVQLDESVAGAGGKLFYPNGTIQHAGIVTGLEVGFARSLWRFEDGHTAGYCGRARALQPMSAITGALMLVKKTAFLEVGGFDAERFPTSYNDVNLWLRMADAGYRCLFNPEVQAIHEESTSRGVSDQEREYQRRMQEDLQGRAYRDPYWNMTIFRAPKALRREERTGVWVGKKVAALEQEVAALRARPRLRVVGVDDADDRSTRNDPVDQNLGRRADRRAA